MRVEIKLSDRHDKRYVAVFYDKDKKVATTHFGYADGKGNYGSTYIDHVDTGKKEAWIARHKVNGTFDDPQSASALARWILWNKKTLRESISDYKRRFKLRDY